MNGRVNNREASDLRRHCAHNDVHVMQQSGVLYCHSPRCYSRAPSQYKGLLPRYGDFHYKDETVVRPSQLYNGNSNAYRNFRYKDEMITRPSYLYNENSHTDKTSSLHWHGPLVPTDAIMCMQSTQSRRMNVCIHGMHMIAILNYPDRKKTIPFDRVWYVQMMNTPIAARRMHSIIMPSMVSLSQFVLCSFNSCRVFRYRIWISTP